MLQEKGETVLVYDLARSDMAEVVAQAFRYDRLILAAASYDGGIFPVMEDFLCHLRSKTFRNRTVGLMENGSWAPSAGKVMKSYLEGMKDITLCQTMVSIRSTMKADTLETMKVLVEEITNR